MLKFLRKYQAWILAIGGSLLMVAFLLPEAIQRLGTPSMNRKIIRLTINGQTAAVRARDWQTAGAEMALLETMFGRTRDLGPLLNLPALDPEDPASPGLHGTDHWLLLKREAQLAGLIGGVSDGDDQLRQQAEFIAQPPQFTAEQAYDRLLEGLATEANRVGLTLDQAKEAFATLAGIRRLIDGYSGSAPASDSRQRHILAQFEDRTAIGFVFIDAATQIDDLPEPDVALLEAHFEKYRDVEPGAGEQGFGYRLEDRVRLEYLTIRYQSVYDRIAGSGLEARKWYQKNASSVSQNPSEPPPPFDEVANDAIAAYRRAKAEETMAEIARFIKSELLRQTQPLERDGLYRVLPEDWAQRRVSFEALREQVQEKFGATVEYRADTQAWAPLSELTTLEGIGGASRQAGALNLGLRQLIAAHREFGGEGPSGLQVGIADPDLLRRNEFSRGRVGAASYPGDAYLYRVLEVDAARPPASLDEVREAVVKDVKRLQAYEGLAADLASWRQRGIDAGLDELAKEMDTFVRRGTVSRYGTTSSKAGNFQPTAVGGLTSPTLVRAVFDRVAPIDPLTRLADLPVEERLFAVAVPERLGVAVVNLERRFPVSQERWRLAIDSGLRLSAISTQSSLSLSQVLMYRDFTDTAMTPFSFEAMKARFNFVDLRETEPQPGEPEMGSGEDQNEGKDEGEGAGEVNGGGEAG